MSAGLLRFLLVIDAEGRHTLKLFSTVHPDSQEHDHTYTHRAQDIELRYSEICWNQENAHFNKQPRTRTDHYRPLPLAERKVVRVMDVLMTREDVEQHRATVKQRWK